MSMTFLRDEDFYRTSDFYLAAAIAVSVPLAAIDRTNPRRTAFIFPRSSELDDLIEDYHKESMRVKPQAYSASIRTLKARLYEE